MTQMARGRGVDIYLDLAQACVADHVPPELLG